MAIKQKRVGFQGEHGAFSEIAAQQMVKGKAALVPYPEFADLFAALKKKQIDYAVIAIENTLAGSVHENYELLLKYRLPILKETAVRIVHALIAPKGVSFPDIRRVYSHHMALKQCKKFFEVHLSQLRPAAAYDTAGSVKMIIEQGLTDAGAIAGQRCAAIYGGRVLMKDIGDNRENFTRFFLLGSSASAEKGAAAKGVKTSLAFITKNRPGALARCLTLFANENIDLAKIESKPLPGRPWEYVFYLDFMGNPRDPAVARALKNLKKATSFVRIFGCYSIVPARGI